MKINSHTENGKTTVKIHFGWITGFIFSLLFFVVFVIAAFGFFGFLVTMFAILFIYWLYCEVADFFFPRKNLAGIRYKRF